MIDTSSSYNEKKKTKPDTKWLNDIKLFLIGYRYGSGTLDNIGLGEHHLTVLKDAIKFINDSPPI